MIQVGVSCITNNLVWSTWKKTDYISCLQRSLDNISPDIVLLLAAGYFTNFIEVPAVSHREHALQTSLKDLLAALKVTLQDAQLS